MKLALTKQGIDNDKLDALEDAQELLPLSNYFANHGLIEEANKIFFEYLEQ